MTSLRTFFLTGITALALVGCGDNAHLPREAGYGPHPTLPAPQKSLISFVHIAPAKGWPPSGGPIAAPGLTLTAFAAGWIIHAGCMCCPMAMCWLRKPTLRPSQTTAKASRLGDRR